MPRRCKVRQGNTENALGRSVTGGGGGVRCARLDLDAVYLRCDRVSDVQPYAELVCPDEVP